MTALTLHFKVRDRATTNGKGVDRITLFKHGEIPPELCSDPDFRIAPLRCEGSSVFFSGRVRGSARPFGVTLTDLEAHSFPLNPMYDTDERAQWLKESDECFLTYKGVTPEGDYEFERVVDLPALDFRLKITYVREITPFVTRHRIVKHGYRSVLEGYVPTDLRDYRLQSVATPLGADESLVWFAAKGAGRNASRGHYTLCDLSTQVHEFSVREDAFSMHPYFKNVMPGEDTCVYLQIRDHHTCAMGVDYFGFEVCEVPRVPRRSSVLSDPPVVIERATEAVPVLEKVVVAHSGPVSTLGTREEAVLALMNLPKDAMVLVTVLPTQQS